MDKDSREILLWDHGEGVSNSVYSIFFKEFMDSIRGSNQRPERIYHYCSMEKALSVLRNRIFWLSPTEKMNDITETEYLKEYIPKYLTEEIKRQAKNFPANPLDFYKSLEEQRAFCCCFSQQRDLLSQWRAYADMGRGLSIGVHPQTMGLLDYFPFKTTKPLEEGHVSLVPMIYNNRNQCKLLIRQITNQHEKFQELGNVGHPLLAGFLADFPYIFKHPAYEEEQEWRMITRCNQEKNSLLGCYSNIQYSVTSKGLTPYMEWSFDSKQNNTISDCPIVEITIGPASETNVQDMRLFLKDNGYENVEVKKSKIPYRN